MSGIGLKGMLLAMLQCVALTGLCATPQANTSAGNAAGTGMGAAPGTVRVALLLPLRSTVLGAAAEAVRAGVQAGFEQDHIGATLTLFETDGSVGELLTTYAAASANHDMIIGPLSRAEVSALAQRGGVTKPTLALSQAESMDADGRVPPRLLRMGLSLEDEARQVADWIASGKGSSSAWVLSTNTPWQKRTAAAFVAEWRARKHPVQNIEIPLTDGVLNANFLNILRKRQRSEIPSVIFVALDAVQAAQVRTALGTDTAMYGTSQLNPAARVSRDSPLPADGGATELRVALDGVLLVDVPWQVAPEHAAVRLYPQLMGQVDPPPGADQARLYALGIDAWRITRELSTRATRFELDGVTGQLRVRFEPGAAHFDRVMQPAVYRSGAVVSIKAP